MSDPLPDERPQRRREYSGPAQTLGLAMLVVVVVGAMIWYFEFREDAGSGGSDEFGIVTLPEGLNTTGEKPAAKEGRLAPDFELENLDGSVTRLSGYRGQWVVLNFWASWCPPCRAETPELQALHERTDGGLAVIGLNQQETEDQARGFAEEFEVTYPVVLDEDGSVSSTYRVGIGLPITFLIDPEGVIETVKIGAYRDGELAELETEYVKR